MRRIALLCLLLPAACGDQTTLSDGQAGDNVARAAISAGSPNIALNVSNAILAKKSDDVPALLSKGDALSLLQRYGEAEAAYTAALDADHNSVEAQIGLGRLSLRSNAPRAQSLFLGALQHDPGNKVALNDLGIAYDLQGNHLRAQESYRRALGSDPTMHAAEVNLALSMALNGHASDAVRILKPLASNPDAPRRLRHDLAVALAMSGDKAGAAKILSADMTPEQIQRTLLAYGEFSQ
jgi:tetratricopeptide (TPR) repeat protein